MGGLSVTLQALEELLQPFARDLAGVAIWSLGLLFLWSGWIKLRAPDRAATAMVEFRVAKTARRELGLLLGSTELALGLLLLVAPGLLVWTTAVAVLLWVFVALIARSLLRGGRFACFCFGEADTKISVITLLRTVVLALMSSLVAWAVARFGAGHSVWGQAALLQLLSAATLIACVALLSKIRQLVTIDARQPGGLGV